MNNWFARLGPEMRQAYLRKQLFAMTPASKSVKLPTSQAPVLACNSYGMVYKFGQLSLKSFGRCEWPSSSATLGSNQTQAKLRR